jgi:DNA-nicking Smr family endonuclease
MIGWLTSPPLAARVMAFASALPRDGGAGACYVLLRRVRPG